MKSDEIFHDEIILRFVKFLETLLIQIFSAAVYVYIYISERAFVSMNLRQLKEDINKVLIAGNGYFILAWLA